MTSTNELIQSVGMGWEPIVREAVSHAKRAGAEIKKVWANGKGMIQFQVEFPSSADRLRHQLNALARTSAKICEECGESGQPVRVARRTSTLCLSCAYEKEYESWEI